MQTKSNFAKEQLFQSLTKPKQRPSSAGKSHYTAEYDAAKASVSIAEKPFLVADETTNTQKYLKEPVP